MLLAAGLFAVAAVIGSRDDVIEVSREEIEWRILQIEANEGALLTDDQRRLVEEAYIDERVLIREAQELGLVVDERIDDILVQKMLHVLSGDVIEAAWGLGEVVVAGLVVPDSFRISTDGHILERIPGEKDLELRPTAEGGIEEIPVGPQRVQALALDNAQLVELHQLTLRCEAEYGPRLDIEWAFADGQLYLLRCRGITR